jgi:hypothetical protein
MEYDNSLKKQLGPVDMFAVWTDGSTDFPIKSSSDPTSPLLQGKRFHVLADRNSPSKFYTLLESEIYADIAGFAEFLYTDVKNNRKYLCTYGDSRLHCPALLP